jgi:hypothetical protein
MTDLFRDAVPSVAHSFDRSIVCHRGSPFSGRFQPNAASAEAASSGPPLPLSRIPRRMKDSQDRDLPVSGR